MNLLCLKNVTVHYEKAEALNGIHLEVPQGEIAALIGPNGAGKSTLLRAISGLKKMTVGEIYFEGVRIDGLSPPKIVQLGIAQVPEGKRIFPHMTVLHNLQMGAYTRKDKRKIKSDMEEIFRYFPIIKLRKSQLAGTLSGGEQQMLAIGRGLMANPKLLVLDEPSLGLSPLLVTEIGGILKNIHKSGVSILLVEQNAELALGLASKVYVLNTGRIVFEGAVQELSEIEFVKKAYIGM